MESSNQKDNCVSCQIYHHYWNMICTIMSSKYILSCISGYLTQSKLCPQKIHRGWKESVLVYSSWKCVYLVKKCTAHKKLSNDVSIKCRTLTLITYDMYVSLEKISLRSSCIQVDFNSLFMFTYFSCWLSTLLYLYIIAILIWTGWCFRLFFFWGFSIEQRWCWYLVRIA